MHAPPNDVEAGHLGRDIHEQPFPAGGLFQALGGTWEDAAIGRFLIVAHTRKPGMDRGLVFVEAKHLRVLKAEASATDKPAYLMRAADGTIIEVFEWRSAEALHRAYSSPAIQALRGEFGAVCDYTPIANLAEAQQMFAEFEPLL